MPPAIADRPVIGSVVGDILNAGKYLYARRAGPVSGSPNAVLLEKMIAVEFKKLLQELCNYGLSNYYVLHKVNEDIFFGQISFDKGHMALRDTGLLQDLKPELFNEVWNEGLIGMISLSEKHQWEDLTFYGLENCDVKPDLSKTRVKSLIAAQNQYGDALIAYTGSIYRAFEMFMNSNFLPVILLKPVKSCAGEIGLKVADLRIVPMKIQLLVQINELVANTIDNRRKLQVDDLDMSDEEFQKYFGGYVSK